MKITHHLIALLPLVLVAGAPLAAFAACTAGADGFVPLACVTDQSSKLSGLYSSPDLSSYINGLFKFAIAVGAAGAVLRLAYAGYLYMGSDMWSKKSDAKAIMGDVTFGLLLLLAIWIILNQINPHILSLNALQNIKSNPVPQTQSTGGIGHN